MLVTVCNVLWRTTDDFWKRTTISGLSNARKSNSGLRRAVWLTLLSVFSILTFTGLSNVINDFYRYPITTSVTVEHNTQVCKITFVVFEFFPTYRSNNVKIPPVKIFKILY